MRAHAHKDTDYAETNLHTDVQEHGCMSRSRHTHAQPNLYKQR